MKHVGIVIKKNELWFTVISGEDRGNCSIEYSGKHNYQADQDITDLMACFHGLFNEIISTYDPDSIGIKLHLESTMIQIPYMHCSLGILAYLCDEKRLPITLRTGAWITAGKKKKLEQCIARFPDENLKTEKLAATLIAWHQFEE